MRPKQRMYIDARHERFELGDAKQVSYIIEKATEDHVKQRIYDSIGLHTVKIEIVPKLEKVIITYYENIISPSYMEYRFQQKGLAFTKADE